ncbi:CBS domain-containing protein [Streptomyces sp. TRM70350]|uniref:CBS domain-containing protein n=1 Tax=Streptomyces sp. TRM70350 TaxID=2856165 RepID=UPI001C45F1E5|nr:CBS domain-containing protein [Streptomyces sp. TRM70350]MBV7697403.1 CBS domain-containing protein [Streptomyces sp. TRM70350]
MAQQVREIMTTDLVTVDPQTPVRDVARRMRDGDIGDVLVVEGDRLRGLVTDRDIVVRLLADTEDLTGKAVRDACSTELVTISPDDDVDQAVRLMRERAVRRLPVVEGGRPVGIVSLGDLAVEQDPDSALGNISAASPND